MLHPQETLNAIDARLLLEEAMGKGRIPGLREAVLASTPVPAQLPAAPLTQEFFLQRFVVPWLAERLRAGEPLKAIHAEYQWHAGGDWYPMSERQMHPMIRLGLLALGLSGTRELLAYDDDTLCALAAVAEGVDEAEFEVHTLYSGDLDCPRRLISELERFADFLSTMGPTLCLSHLYLDKVIVLGPVILHVRAVVQDLRGALIRS